MRFLESRRRHTYARRARPGWHDVADVPHIVRSRNDDHGKSSAERDGHHVHGSAEPRAVTATAVTPDTIVLDVFIH